MFYAYQSFTYDELKPVVSHTLDALATSEKMLLWEDINSYWSFQLVQQQEPFAATILNVFGRMRRTSEPELLDSFAVYPTVDCIVPLLLQSINTAVYELNNYFRKDLLVFPPVPLADAKVE